MSDVKCKPGIRVHVLVEGNCDILRKVVSDLHKGGHCVMHAVTAQQALDMFQDYKWEIDRIFIGGADEATLEAVRVMLSDPERCVVPLSTNPLEECRQLQKKYGCSIVEQPDVQHIEASIFAGMPV